MNNEDLAGEPIFVSPEIQQTFIQLEEDAEALKAAGKRLNQAIEEDLHSVEVVYAAEIQHLEEQIRALEAKLKPAMDDVNEKFIPKKRQLSRAMQRLDIDFQAAWDKLFEVHPEYRGRRLLFDRDKQFKFHPKGHGFQDEQLDQLNKMLGPLGLKVEYDDKKKEENEDE